jgi:hypothetical protein
MTLDFIPAEKATELGLTEDQLTAIAPLHNEWLATQKQAWDGKASKDADTILDNVTKTIADKYGYAEPRQQGEKAEDYLLKVDNHRLGSLKTDYENKKKEYETKLKNFDGGEAQKQQLEELKSKFDAAQQKLANFDDLSDKATKFDSLSSEYAKLKQGFAFTQVKPSFPDTVNAYEAEAKYNAFIQRTEEKYNIEIVDNIAWAIEKENIHSKKKLSELVGLDKELSELSQGRQQQGTGARQSQGNIQGLEVSIPIGSSGAEASKIINDYLDSKGIKANDTERTAKFTEIWNKYRAASPLA